MNEPAADQKVSLPIKANAYRHQTEAFEFVIRMFGVDGQPVSQGVALLMEMGLGKSLTSIAIAGALYMRRRIKKMLVVAPLSILGVWREEFEKFASFDYTLAVLTGSAMKKADTLRNMRGTPLQVVVINYESAWRLEKELVASLMRERRFVCGYSMIEERYEFKRGDDIV